MTIRCTVCKCDKTKTLETRSGDGRVRTPNGPAEEVGPREGTIRRRRECLECGHRFFTIEILETEVPGWSRHLSSDMDAIIGLAKRIVGRATILKERDQ